MGGGEASKFTDTVQAIRAEMSIKKKREREGKKAFFSLQGQTLAKSAN